jgi:hypothetical protein
MVTRTFTFQIDGSEQLSKRFDVTAGSLLTLDEAIPSGSGNTEVLAAIDVAQLKGLFVVADIDMVLKTNDAGSPNNTITLAAGKPFVWTQFSPAIRDTAGALITTDIVSIFASRNADTVGNLSIRALVDPTA